MVDENQKLTKENKDLKKVNSDLLSRLNFLENQMREIKSEIISEVLQEDQNKQTHSENNTSHHVVKFSVAYVKNKTEKFVS